MLSAEDIQIPTAGWQEIAPIEGARRWQNVAGDQRTLHFFGIVPDLPSGPNALAELRQIYRDALAEIGGIVEVEPVIVCGIHSVRAIFKIRQNPTGMTYLGSLTIPFRDCSFVIKWQCPEHGVTGLRDAGVFAVVAPPVDDLTGEPQGWAEDPYDPTARTAAPRNRADDPEWDSKFPEHPLSRLRSYLHGFGGVRLSPAAAKEPRYSSP